jgi:integrase
MELLAARWEEFDLKEGIWRLPGDRTKTGSGQEIPLAAPVLDWLEELRIRAGGSPYLFPARRTSKRFPHVSPDTLNVALNSLTHGLEPFTVHDFRRTTRTLLASLGVSGNVAERCLNHKLRGLEGIYNRHDYFEERKAALSQLATLLISIKQGNDKVVPLQSGKAA